MCCDGHKFSIKRLDENMKTSDKGIVVVFQVINVASRGDIHPKVFYIQYYGHQHDILECDFKSFKIVLFSVKWFRLRIHECGRDKTVIEHANGFTIVDTRNVELGSNPYVLPSLCEKGFNVDVPGKVDWSYVRYDPRGRSVKYNVAEELDEIKEEDDVEE